VVAVPCNQWYPELPTVSSSISCSCNVS